MSHLMAPGPTKTRRMSAEARREQLLDVTTELVAEQGFQELTVEAVARRAGITRPIIYEHFGDLAGLLDAVVQREMARAMAQVSETALTRLTEGPPVDLMIESLRSYLHTVRSHPATWRLVLTPPEGVPPILRERIAAGRAEVLAGLVERRPPGNVGEPALARRGADREAAVGDRRRVRAARPRRSRALQPGAPARARALDPRARSARHRRRGVAPTPRPPGAARSSRGSIRILACASGSPSASKAPSTPSRPTVAGDQRRRR